MGGDNKSPKRAETEIFRADVDNGKIKIHLTPSKHMTVILLALKLLEMEIENIIIAANQPRVEKVAPISNKLESIRNKIIGS